MPSFRLTPGRIAWIALLVLLFVVAPRPRRHAPQAAPPPERNVFDAPRRQILEMVTGENIPPARTMGLEEDLFTSDTLVRIDIHIPHDGLVVLRDYHWQKGNHAREDVAATVREGDKVYKNVAVHLKGSAGSFEPVDARPSLSLNFDKLSPGQQFHGLKKIHLNGSRQDGTRISEQLSREMFNAAGVPTPRATQAKVSLNGRSLGVYVLVEGANKQFLKQHFKDASGVLYDGGFVTEVNTSLEVDSGDEATSRADLRALTQAVSESGQTARLAKFEAVLDVERYLSMVAMEVLTVHWDGYSMNRNNYRIYHDPGTDRLVFMPHGLDQMFAHRRMSADLVIMPPQRMSGSVTQRLLEIPSVRARYYERIGQLFTNVYKTDVLLARVDQIADRMRPFLAEDGIAAVRWHRNEVNALRDRIERRGQSVQNQLRGGPPQSLQPAQPVQFDKSGVFSLKQAGTWQPKVTTSPVSFRASIQQDAQTLLGINLTEPPVNPGMPRAGSWRRTLVLGPGQYRFAGMASAKGLVIEPGEPEPNDQGRRMFSGVGLRISGGELQKRLTGDASNTEVYCDFALTEVQEVELVCEGKALQGEATFDASTLRLIRK